MRVVVVGLIALAFGCANVVVGRRVPADKSDAKDRLRWFLVAVGLSTTAMALVTIVAGLVGLIRQ